MRIPPGLTAAARSLWDDGFTLEDARADNPEYLRGQVETIAHASVYESHEDSEQAMDIIAEAIFANSTISVVVAYRPHLITPEQVVEQANFVLRSRPGIIAVTVDDSVVTDA